MTVSGNFEEYSLVDDGGDRHVLPSRTDRSRHSESVGRASQGRRGDGTRRRRRRNDGSGLDSDIGSRLEEKRVGIGLYERGWWNRERES